MFNFIFDSNTNQLVCTLSGSRPQSSVIAGADYLKGFGYDHSHLWRNFGIIIAFTVAYLLVAMIGVEYMDFGAGGGSIKILTKKPEAVDGGLPTIEKGKRETEKPVEDMEITRKNSTVKGRGSIFTWRNVNYSIGEAQLLSNINGFAKPGRITALMGPSGAGKTTLLDNLGLRKRVGVTSGELLMDGKELMPDFGRSTAFVEQQDVHDGMFNYNMVVHGLTCACVRNVDCQGGHEVLSAAPPASECFQRGEI